MRRVGDLDTTGSPRSIGRHEAQRRHRAGRHQTKARELQAAKDAAKGARENAKSRTGEPQNARNAGFGHGPRATNTAHKQDAQWTGGAHDGRARRSNRGWPEDGTDARRKEHASVVRSQVGQHSSPMTGVALTHH